MPPQCASHLLLAAGALSRQKEGRASGQSRDVPPPCAPGCSPPEYNCMLYPVEPYHDGPRLTIKIYLKICGRLRNLLIKICAGGPGGDRLDDRLEDETCTLGRRVRGQAVAAPRRQPPARCQPHVEGARLAGSGVRLLHPHNLPADDEGGEAGRCGGRDGVRIGEARPVHKVQTSLSPADRDLAHNPDHTPREPPAPVNGRRCDSIRPTLAAASCS